MKGAFHCLKKGCELAFPTSVTSKKHYNTFSYSIGAQLVNISTVVEFATLLGVPIRSIELPHFLSKHIVYVDQLAASSMQLAASRYFVLLVKEGGKHY